MIQSPNPRRYPYSTLVGSITVNLLPAGPVEILGVNQGQLYWVYYSDPGTTGGNVTMLATQNRSDYLNKAGFYEVGSCTWSARPFMYQFQ